MEELTASSGPGAATTRRTQSPPALLGDPRTVAPEHSPSAISTIAGFGYYSNCRFRQVSLRVKLLAFWRWLGFEFLVNHFPRYRRFWEHYLCYVVRGKVMEFEFEVIK
jgi:hypothetical protein